MLLRRLGVDLFSLHFFASLAGAGQRAWYRGRPAVPGSSLSKSLLSCCFLFVMAVFMLVGEATSPPREIINSSVVLLITRYSTSSLFIDLWEDDCGLKSQPLPKLAGKLVWHSPLTKSS